MGNSSSFADLFILTLILAGFAYPYNEDDGDDVCLVPWTSEGSIDVKGEINDDLLTVNQGVQIVLTCRPRLVVINGSSTSTCSPNGQWSPKLGVCVRSFSPGAGGTGVLTESITASTTASTALPATPAPSRRTTTRRGPPEPACGLSKYPFAGTRTQRILGQLPALSNEFPWQARLVIGARSNMICAGAVVDRYYVLTTASCVSAALNTGGSILKVFVGGNRIGVADATEKNYEVVAQRIHPLFQERNRDYNFALVKVSEPMPFNDNVNKVCLLTNYCDGESRPGTYCATSGWNNADRSKVDVLQKNVARIGWKLECKITVTRDNGDLIEVTDRQLCAGFPSIPFDSRNETPDNGQPLVCQSGSGSYYLTGIFSHRRQLTTQTTSNGTIISKLVIDIYARPCSVMDWMEQVFSGQETNSN